MKICKQSAFIITSVVLLSIIMSLVDLVWQPGYLIKSIIKLVLFLAFPIMFFIFSKTTGNLKALFKPSFKSIGIALAVGAGIYLIILGAYFLLKNHFDFSGITDSLVSGAGVNAENFVYVSIYISFVNSLLEEFFFRGFAFLTLSRYMPRIFSYLFSAAIFSLYHVGMTFGWMNFVLTCLMFLGLFMGGLIFNYFNDKSKNIYISWLIHMFANFSINTIGFILFDII